MNKLVYVLASILITCVGCGGGSSSASINPVVPVIPPVSQPDAYIIFVLGQSNADGRGEVIRLQNTTYNQRGYVAHPSNVKIYSKPFLNSTDFYKDNGAWQDYYAGVNSSTDGTVLNHFGPELALSQFIVNSTGKPVYIIKAAFGGTALSPGIPTYKPGNWLDTNRYIAAFYFKSAIRDIKSIPSVKNPKFLGVLWWQGESDALANVSPEAYVSNFNELKGFIDEKITAEGFGGYKWLLTELNYMQSPGEALINTGVSSYISKSQNVGFLTTSSYPRKKDLDSTQKYPLEIGPADDEHCSFICQIGVGEQAAKKFFGE